MAGVADHAKHRSPDGPGQRARGLGPEERVVRAGEHQRRRRDAVELAARVVPGAGDAELHQLGARGGLGADEALDPAHLVGLILAEGAREDAIGLIKIGLNVVANTATLAPLFRGVLIARGRKKRVGSW